MVDYAKQENSTLEGLELMVEKCTGKSVSLVLLVATKSPSLLLEFKVTQAGTTQEHLASDCGRGAQYALVHLGNLQKLAQNRQEWRSYVAALHI